MRTRRLVARRKLRPLAKVVASDMAFGITEALTYRKATPKDIRLARVAMRRLVEDDGFWNKLADFALHISRAERVREAIKRETS
jgi:hypothetical protein